MLLFYRQFCFASKDKSRYDCAMWLFAFNCVYTHTIQNCLAVAAKVAEAITATVMKHRVMHEIYIYRLDESEIAGKQTSIHSSIQITSLTHTSIPSMQWIKRVWFCSSKSLPYFHLFYSLYAARSTCVNRNCEFITSICKREWVMFARVDGWYLT